MYAFTGLAKDRQHAFSATYARGDDTFFASNWQAVSAEFLAALDAGVLPAVAPPDLDTVLAAAALGSYSKRTGSQDAEPWLLEGITVRVGPEPQAGLTAAGLVRVQPA